MIFVLAAVLCFCSSGLAQVRNDNDEKTTREERILRLQKRTWEAKAFRVQGRIRIDGRLDEPDWEMAEPVDEFYQRERNEGLPATERTEVRILYDQTNLYIGFRCFDREPEKMKARSMFRDESGGADDLVAVMLDAFNDHRSAIQFVTNASGLVEDLLQTGETTDTRNSNWDTVWNSQGSRNPSGWEVEIIIPFKSLRFQPPATGEEAVFGIGLKRNIPRKNEEVYWPFVGNNSSWYRPAELGHLRGLYGIEPGRSIEVRPYGLVGAHSDRDLQITEGRKDAGLDVKWGITPGLTADFTVNTDFAQEEADVQQNNFTRFSLFFPEKRQFFLEGERMFQFGVPKENDLVFTRRIGLSDAGEIIPIRAGTRLSGRQGRFSLGAMNIQTGSVNDLPGENFTVLRVRRDVLNRSSVGVLFTNRQGGGDFNRVYGADFNFYFNRAWFLEGFLARVDEPGQAAGRGSAYARFAYDTDRFGATYRYLDIGENFDPGVGFVRRPDSRENFGQFRFSPRPNLSWIRKFDVETSIRYITNQTNVLESRERNGQFTTNFESGDALSFEFANRLEFIDRTFELRDDVVIPPGVYRFNTFESKLETFRRRHIRLNLNFLTGGFWSGSRNTLGLDGSYRINRNFDVSGNYEINWIDLPEGKFTSHLLSSRFQVIFRNNLALKSLFQYNRDTHLLSSNIRFNWIPKPGTDFFIVYNELDEWGGVFNMKNRSLAVKLNYLFAF